MLYLVLALVSCAVAFAFRRQIIGWVLGYFFNIGPQ